MVFVILCFRTELKNELLSFYFEQQPLRWSYKPVVKLKVVQPSKLHDQAPCVNRAVSSC